MAKIQISPEYEKIYSTIAGIRIIVFKKICIFTKSE